MFKTFYMQFKESLITQNINSLKNIIVIEYKNKVLHSSIDGLNKDHYAVLNSAKYKFNTGISRKKCL